MAYAQIRSTHPSSPADTVILGTLGQVSALTWSFTVPGGCDQMSCTLEREPSFRSGALNPGRDIEVMHGGSTVWTGKLMDPQPSDDGWLIVANGTGNMGDDYDALYTGAWASVMPDNAINQAIARGLPWTNPGINSVPNVYLGQVVDSGAQSITDLLNLACTKGGLTWYVNPRPGRAVNMLSVVNIPANPNRLLVVNDPAARTLGGDYNTVHLRRAATNDSSGQPATYAVSTATDAPSIFAHQAMEQYVDLSSAGVLTDAAAVALGNLVLARYQRASFASPFTVAHGGLLNLGGVPVDLAAEQAGSVVRLILADYGYGGEITPGPVSFLVAGYQWDEDSQTATVTPFESYRTDFSSVLQMVTGSAAGDRKPKAGVPNPGGPMRRA